MMLNLMLKCSLRLCLTADDGFYQVPIGVKKTMEIASIYAWPPQEVGSAGVVMITSWSTPPTAA